MRYLIAIVFVTCTLAGVTSAQPQDSSRSGTIVSMQFRSALLEAYIYPVGGVLGLCVDVDVLRAGAKGTYAAGIRLRCAANSGNVALSDYAFSYNLVAPLIRLSYRGDVHIDAYAGATWLGVWQSGFNMPLEYDDYIRPMIGADIRWMVIPHTFGLSLRAAMILDAPPGVRDNVFDDAGIGIVVGWEP